MVYYTYKSTYGNIAHYICDYGDNFNEDYYDLNEFEKRIFMDKEIKSLVDDCEKVVTWTIRRIKIEDI